MLKLNTIRIIGILFIVGCGDVTGNLDSGSPVVADSGIDADNSKRQFEVVYVSALSISAMLFTAANMGVVVNRGTAPLDLSNVRIVSTTDSHPQVIFDMNASISNTFLSPNYAAGNLSPAAKALIIDTGMVTEARSDLQYSMSISLRDAPDGDYTVTASAVLEIDGIQVEIPISFQHGTSVSFNGVNRVLSKSQP